MNDKISDYIKLITEIRKSQDTICAVINAIERHDDSYVKLLVIPALRDVAIRMAEHSFFVGRLGDECTKRGDTKEEANESIKDYRSTHS